MNISFALSKNAYEYLVRNVQLLGCIKGIFISKRKQKTLNSVYQTFRHNSHYNIFLNCADLFLHFLFII